MTASLLTGLNRHFPVNIVTSPNQDIIISNGVDPWYRWDGKTASAEYSGVGSGYLGAIPVLWNSGGVGIPDGATVQVGFQYFDRDMVPGNVTALTELTASAPSQGIQWDFTNLAARAPARAKYIKLLRTKGDQVSPLYYVTNPLSGNEEIFDVDTAAGLYPYPGAPFTDSLTDAELEVGNSVTLVNSNGETPTQATVHGIPPWQMSQCISHRNRMFAAVPVVYNIGHVEVTNGSGTVNGVGTEWPFTIATPAVVQGDAGAWWEADLNFSRRNSPQTTFKFAVVGDDTEYDITYPTSSTSLILARSITFAGTSNKFARYAIFPPAEEFLKVYYTYLDNDFHPESWPAEYYIRAYQEGGPLTSLITAGPSLLFAKRAKLFRFDVQVDPADDGAQTLNNSERGCENPRTWVEAAGRTFIMDRQGIYWHDGFRATDISEQIGDLFKYSKINWRGSKWFHMCYDQEKSVVMAFVAHGGDRYPNKALCYSLKTNTWWDQKYHRNIASSTTSVFGFGRKVILGGTGAKIQVDAGDTCLDSVTKANTETLRGFVESASLFTITDSDAVFSSSLVGTPIMLIDGTGKRMLRTILSATSGVITVDKPMIPIPDSTTQYQIGAFEWSLKTPCQKLTQRFADTSRRTEVRYEPCDFENWLFLRHYMNRNKQPSNWNDQNSTGDISSEDGVTIRANDPDVRIELKLKQSRLTDNTNTFDDEGQKGVEWSGNTDTAGAADHNITQEVWGSAHSVQERTKINGLETDGVR